MSNGGRWPLPTIMNEAKFKSELEELASRSKSCNPLIKIILALARYHKKCYKAQQVLADEINEILGPDQSHEEAN